MVMTKQLANKQQGLILLTNLIILAIVSAWILALWHQIAQQSYVVRQDKQLNEEHQALNQLSQKVDRHFLYTHRHCHNRSKTCSIKINNTILHFYWQNLTRYTCVKMQKYQVALWQVVAFANRQRSGQAKILLWTRSSKLFQPNKCSNHTIKTLKQPKRSWLLEA